MLTAQKGNIASSQQNKHSTKSTKSSIDIQHGTKSPT